MHSRERPFAGSLPPEPPGTNPLHPPRHSSSFICDYICLILISVFRNLVPLENQVKRQICRSMFIDIAAHVTELLWAEIGHEIIPISVEKRHPIALLAGTVPLPTLPATQIGMRGFWTGDGMNKASWI